VQPFTGGRLFVGRENEVRRLHDLLDGAAAGHGGASLISGEAGIGKTRLMQAAMEEATARRFRVAWAANYEYARSPLGPFADAFGTLLRAMPDALPRVSADRTALLGLAGMAEPAASIDMRRMLVVMTETLARIGERDPFLLVVDDVQWADPESLEFIRYLAPRLLTIAGTLLVGIRTTTPEASDALSALIGVPGMPELELAPLTDTASRTLVAAAQPENVRLEQRTVDAITARAEGNPLFLQELARESAATSPRKPSTSVRHAIAAQLARLDDATLRILEAAAVIGRRFTIERLSRVGDVDSNAVVGALRLARDAKLIEEIGLQEFQFRHELIRATVYERLLAVQRRALHHRVAEDLDQQSVGSADELALHRLAAGDLIAGVAAAEAAGDEAAALNAIASARDRYLDADRAGVLSGADKARLDGKLARAFHLLGDAENAAERHALAAHYYESVGDIPTSTQHTLQFANVAYRAGRIAEANAACERVIATAPSPQIAFAARSLYAMFLAMRDERETALVQIRAAEELSVSPEAADEIPLHYAKLTVARFEQGNDWFEPATAAVARAEEVGEPAGLAHALFNYGIVAYERGRENDGLKALERAVDVADRHGRVLAGAFARCELIYIHTLGGRLHEALRLILTLSGLYVNTLKVRLSFAEVATPVLADLGQLERFPAVTDPGLVDEARRAGAREYAATVAAQLHAATALGKRFDDALVADALGTVHSTRYISPSFLTFARFADTRHFARIQTLFGSGPLASRELRTLRKTAKAVMAARVGDDAAKELLREATEDCDIAGMPLLAALCLELSCKVGEALRLYESCGATAHVRRLRVSAAQTLTPRENEIAALVAQGRSNRAIAEALVLSERTVEHHVAAILRKFDLKGRADLPGRFYGSEGTERS